MHAMRKLSLLFMLVSTMNPILQAAENLNLPGQTLNESFTKVSVLNPEGEVPKKSDALDIRVKIKNLGKVLATYHIKPSLSSLRFTDYSNIPLGEKSVELIPGEEQEVCFTLDHLFEDKDQNKRYALGRGEYVIDLNVQDSEGGSLETPQVKFEIAKSPVVNVVVIYDPKYFEIGEDRIGRDPVDWVREAQSRSASVYNPSTKEVTTFAGGFQELLGVKEVYQAFGNVKFVETKGDVMPYFATAEAGAKEALGLKANWKSICQGTCLEHHGFDYMIALNPIFMGGVALSSGQVSGGFSFDQSQGRSQMVLTHESGHVYGAPHCDPIQGYVMCSGEKAESYKENGDFLWHADSLKAMNPKKFE